MSPIRKLRLLIIIQARINACALYGIEKPNPESKLSFELWFSSLISLRALVYKSRGYLCEHLTMTS
jgi:hypothetical protein